MSVRKGDRTEGKLQVLNDMRILTEYTVKICQSEKAFPKKSRWVLPNRIINECLDAATCVRRANSYQLSEEFYPRRRELQAEAKTHLEAMLMLIDLAYSVHQIESNRVEHWTGLVVTAERRISAWAKSDRERLK